MNEKLAQTREFEFNPFLLAEFLREHKIYYVGWDVDGTLVKTGETFRNGVDRANSWLIGIPPSRLRGAAQLGRLRTIRGYTRSVITGTRQERQTHPAIMDISIQNTALRLGVPLISEWVKKAKNEIREIYNGRCPDPYPGAIETLKTFEQTGISQMVATHAGKDWTLRKISHMGIDSDMFDHIICMDTCRSKQEQWKASLEPIGIDPHHLLVFGDNPEADIRATRKLGAKCVFINKYRQNYPDLEKDKNIWIVNHISETIPALTQTM